MAQGGLSAETINNIFGSVKNPLDNERSAGGSSGGEAALLALKCVPLSIGSDIGGSIRNPCNQCGLVGFKPTAHRVPDKSPCRRNGPPSMIGTWGPMGNTVEDMSLVMRSVFCSEVFKQTKMTAPVPWSEDLYTSTKPLRIGYVLEESSCVPTHSTATRAVQVAVDKLKAAGHTLVPFEPES
jgi:Asp-tRNA(Asn)/Glu-tRNA(Gln) amidotransferase A subunit family amidase